MDEQNRLQQLVNEVAPELSSYWLEQFEQATRKEVKAMVELALFYKDYAVYKEMYKWLEQAVELQYPDAIYELANCYLESLDHKGSEKLALHYYERAALLGHPDAMNNLADMYFNGEGTDVDEELALKWFTKASKLGVVEAMYTLGIMHEQGLGTTQDPVKALNYYEAAANGQYADALYRMGMIFFAGELEQEQSDQQALYWFFKGAEQFHLDALYNVAYCFEHGYGVERSLEEAIRYYKQASLLSDIESTKKLVGIYEAIDTKKAQKWRDKLEQLQRGGQENEKNN